MGQADEKDEDPPPWQGPLPIVERRLKRKADVRGFGAEDEEMREEGGLQPEEEVRDNLDRDAPPGLDLRPEVPYLMLTYIAINVSLRKESRETVLMMMQTLMNLKLRDLGMTSWTSCLPRSTP